MPYPNLIKMKIAAHITFFYVESRLCYLKAVIENLRTIEEDVHIYIYTNQPIHDLPLEQVTVLQYPYKKQKWVELLSFFDFKFLRSFTYPISRALSQYLYFGFKKLGLSKYIHPFYLTWENRSVVKKILNDYDVQMYLEDDIGFGKDAFEYWLKYADTCIKNGYNLGFLRTEIDPKGDFYITDLHQLPENIIELDGKLFLINDVNTYCAFWIYTKEELSKFIMLKAWNFNFRGQNVREKSAVGWHSKGMKHYKGTIIPLFIENDSTLRTEIGCSIRHLPNNYIGDAVFCKLPFPIKLK